MLPDMDKAELDFLLGSITNTDRYYCGCDTCEYLIKHKTYKVLYKKFVGYSCLISDLLATYKLMKHNETK